MNHEFYMQRCIELAQLGQGYTHPNPMVGSVIVESGEIIGEGWHRKAGTPHAEVHAIDSVQDKSRLANATIYVSLEPCAHHGKTPPCANRIVQEGIPHVVVGTLDPHSVVSGKGVEILEKAGVSVVVGVLENECQALNRAFFTFHNEKRPFVTLKWARSADGYLAPSPEARESGIPAWITGSRSKQMVHKLRASVDGILVGGRTVVDDNPSLTTRLWPGTDPQRIVWTSRPIDSQATIMSDGLPTWVIGPNASDYGYSAPIEAWNALSAVELLHQLYERGIMHLLIEGGAKTIEKFTKDELWDEAYILTGTTVFGSGTPSPDLHHAKIIDSHWVEDDLWQRFVHV